MNSNPIINLAKNIFYSKTALILLVFFSVVGCVEPYHLQTNTYEEAIVIEATITNELKNHQIKISKTYRFEENGPTIISGAQVYITDNAGNQYNFVEQSGLYISTQEFQAVPERLYTLTVVNEGKSYQSSAEILTPINPMESVTAAVETVDDVTGVQIRANGFDPSGSSRYYRYEYEETNKIIAPQWVSEKAIGTYNANGGVNQNPGYITIVPRDYEARICFNTKHSTEIILDNTNFLNEDRVQTPIRFIAKNDYLIANRYSIKVRQYIQNLASYTFYNTLKELSGTESLLSQNQPGFFYGNLRSLEDSNEKVIGFFEVSSVSEQRIFFNYTDIFPNPEVVPEYPYRCEQINLIFCFGSPGCSGFDLLDGFINETISYSTHLGIEYVVYPIQCGDCTSFSSNIIPSFWYD
jgi:hypothetical protein